MPVGTFRCGYATCFRRDELLSEKANFESVRSQKNHQDLHLVVYHVTNKSCAQKAHLTESIAELSFGVKIIVQKYGGKSVGTIERIESVAADIVARHSGGERLVIVVSAMANTTDQLIAEAKQISPKPPERELDMLLSAGERISMALLSIAICKLGAPAISFTGSQSGIITDDLHSRARIVEIRATRIIEELHKGKIVIVAGFQGVSARREITTLGRGGSDTTAVALACALGAERCEIYSDVDGFYSADPKAISTAKFYSNIDFDQLFFTTFYGSKVVHPRAVELAKTFSMPLYLASSINKGRYTMVQSFAMEGTQFSAISVNAQIVWVSVELKSSAVPEFFAQLEKTRTPVANTSLVGSGERVEICFWAQDVFAQEITCALDVVNARILVFCNAAVVAISGHGIADSAESCAKFFDCARSFTEQIFYAGVGESGIFAVCAQELATEFGTILHQKLLKG